MSIIKILMIISGILYVVIGLIIAQISNRVERSVSKRNLSTYQKILIVLFWPIISLVVSVFDPRKLF